MKFNPKMRTRAAKPMTAEQVRQYLEYYRDLGITHLNLSSLPVFSAGAAAAPVPVAAAAIPTPKAPSMDIVLPTLAPVGDTLAKIREDIGDCKRCGLCKTRKSIVYGSGDERARLVFVGEGPGADEDEQGFPFVGRAGQLGDQSFCRSVGQSVRSSGRQLVSL